MSAKFHVDTDRIQAASGDIARISGDIEAQVAAMMARLNALQDAWQGSASSQFQSVSQQWQGTQRQVQQGLDNISRVLAAAGARYAQTEAEATRLFS